MRLASGGIDIFYIDESMDDDVYAITSVAIPFLRFVDQVWTIVWPDHFEAIRDWRTDVKNVHGIPVRKELHGNKLASGRGRYRHGKQQFSRRAAAGVYGDLLSRLVFLPDTSIISVVGTRSSKLYGQTKLEAILHALLQRMRKACSDTKRNGLVFFDEGHGEYRKLYRRSLVYLPTGSQFGGWSSLGFSKNLPLDNFVKDGNEKSSKHSFYIQLADLIVYALKIKGERKSLTSWQAANNLQDLYGKIPMAKLNTKASWKDPLGIVRL
jgi:hypothetical protein